MSGPRFVAVAGLKGGTGKTCVAVNLAGALALKGRSVVLLDMDPLAAASYHLSADPPPRTLADCLEGLSALPSVLAETSVPGLRFAAGSRALAAWDRRPERLGVAMDRVFSQVPESVDHVVLDLPPSSGAIVRCALANLPGGAVVAPVQARVLDLLGFADLEQLVHELRESNPSLELVAIVPTRTNRTVLAAKVIEGLQEAHGNKVLPGIPESAAAAKAPLAHKPVVQAFPKSPVSEAFEALTQTVLRLETATYEHRHTEV